MKSATEKRRPFSLMIFRPIAIWIRFIIISGGKGRIGEQGTRQKILPKIITD
jgi:hypothetical protein